jgi:hypothetical protein
MDQGRIDELRKFFAALSDESRLKIAASIVDRPRTVGEIAADLSMKDAAVARHLAMLAGIGLVIETQDGGSVRYQLDAGTLRSRRKDLLARERNPPPADNPGVPDGDRIILSRFLDGVRLKEIPSDRGKRMVVLSWLVNQFEEERRYREKEVNDIIKRHHPDSSALRRYMIDHRFMQRENGVYWRLPASDPAADVNEAIQE